MHMRSVTVLLLCTATPLATAQDVACPPPLEGAGHAMTGYDIQHNNNCSLPPDELHVAAVSEAMFAGSARCGECLLVEGNAGSMVVRVISSGGLCPSCADEDIDLSEAAFLAITGKPDGLEPVTWQRVRSAVRCNSVSRAARTTGT